jgi:copper chaperone CopZ
MDRRTFCRSSLLATAALALGQAAQAASPGTLIEVDDMHCANCARKIASKLYGVPGVVAVRCNVAANTAAITPQQQRQPSPKAMWEAVEKAGFKPVKLQGPHGIFTTKPRA